MIRGRRIHGAVVAALALAASACGVTHVRDLNFTVDQRLQFLSPPARSLVTAPLTVRWTMTGFRPEAPGAGPPRRDAGYFAVFVDRAPIRPEETMRALAAADPLCLHRPGCPDAAYLAQRQIYTTTSDSLTIPQVPPVSGNTERIQYHTITVVLMDTSGHRIGESAWELDVRMRRPGL